MTSLMIYLFGKQPWFSLSNLADEAAQEPHRERNRLKKPAPQEEFHSCDEFLDIIRSQSYLTLHHNESNATVLYRDNLETQCRRENPPSMKSKQSNDPISLYPHYEMRSEELRRTRAKTPVYRIGQLEDKTCLDTKKDIDTARVLAQQYQETLPARSFTPLPETTPQNAHRNGLRRIKCHDSLRDIVKSIPEEEDQASKFAAPNPLANSSLDIGRPSNHETLQESITGHHMTKLHSSRSRFHRGSFETHFNRRHSSDSETLVGSDSETSPNSPALRSISSSDMDTIKIIQDCQTSSIQEDFPDPTVAGNTVGMQLCMDLLTNDLATALYRQHPAEGGNRVSGLQILLMIEAYETLQQRLREEVLSSEVRDISEEHVKDVDSSLDHWLQALRSIYERSLSRDRGNLREPVPS
jgi:hypothetical protein